jgi:hypothetical protein
MSTYTALWLLSTKQCARTSDNIKFYDDTADDPNWKVKQCLLALITASSKIEDGFACWMSGKGLGRKWMPDFGKWVPLNEMKCFVSTVKGIFAERKWWYREVCDINWDIFMPTIHKWNECRVKLLVAFLLILDESMSGWKPKNNKSGGLPNISFEPRKTVPLGTVQCYEMQHVSRDSAAVSTVSATFSNIQHKSRVVSFS